MSIGASDRPPVVGLALFGSRARSDHGPDADVDLLAVTSPTERPAGPDPAPGVCHGEVHLSRYPLDRLLRRAEAGDLFVLHLTCEAVVLFDTGDVFDRIRRSFRYRPDYEREIRLASDVGWFVVRHADRFADGRSVNRRIGWCTRTILTARAADARAPVFSARGLAELAGTPDVERLIADRHRIDLDPATLTRFVEVLRRCGAPPPPLLDPAEQRHAFTADRNLAGLSALAAVRPGVGGPHGRQTEGPLTAAETRGD